MIVTVYETQAPHAKPEHRFVALIDWNGFKGNKHLCSFTRAATYEAALQKGKDFVESTLNPLKKHKTPGDSTTISPVPLDNTEEPPEETFPI